MNRKYRLTDETIIHYGRELHKIESLCNFDNVVIGQKGGFVENEYNLSHDGNCWIYENAKVYDEAIVSEDAKVYDNAEIGNNAKVYGSAIVRNEASITGYAKVFDNALVRDMSSIYGESKVYNNAIVAGNAHIYNVEIKDSSDYIVFKNWWSSYRYFTWTRYNNLWKVGCFYGTGKELIAKAYKDSKLSGREYERIVRYVEAINQPAKRLNRIQRIVCKLFKIR